MTIHDPKMPLRKDLEVMCNGNQRLVKAFESLFKLIPSELNKGSDDNESAQLSADNAAAQALLGASLILAAQAQIEMSALTPSQVFQNQESFDFSPRFEQTFNDQIYPSHEQIGCTNYNLEIT